jgi:hypothetical protein
MGFLWCSDTRYYTGKRSTASVSSNEQAMTDINAIGRRELLIVLRVLSGKSLLSSYAFLLLRPIADATNSRICVGSYRGTLAYRSACAAGLGYYPVMQRTQDRRVGISLAQLSERTWDRGIKWLVRKQDDFPLY